MSKEKFMIGVASAIGGAILLAIIGFLWGGWVTAGAAREMAEEMAEDAVLDRLAPICVAKFNKDAEKDQKLKELEATSSWERGKYIEKQGWATIPGEKEPDSKVASACADRLMQIKP
jgi:hypothetical protein